MSTPTEQSLSIILTSCGLAHDRVVLDWARRDKIARVYLERDTAWTYDVLSQIATALGTTDMRFCWEGGGPGGDLTPPQPDEMWIEIRLPG